MSGIVGILLSVLGFTSVVHKNRIDSMHPVLMGNGQYKYEKYDDFFLLTLYFTTYWQHFWSSFSYFCAVSKEIKHFYNLQPFVIISSETLSITI